MPRPARCFLVGLALVAGAAALLAAAAVSGWLSRGAPHHAAAAASAEPVAVVLARFVLALAVIGLLAGLGGALARRLGQPPVIGEIVAGVILGPSVLGNYAPGLSRQIFPAQVLPYVYLAAQAGLVIFMFTVGAEMAPGDLGRQRSALGAASLAIMSVPFALGLVAAVPVYHLFAGGSAARVPFAIFIGTAMSVTAFPVLARIVRDSGLSGTRIGTLAMLCAAGCDVLAWCALAVALAVTHAQGPAGALRALALTGALSAAFLFLVRPALRAVATRYADAAVPESVRVLLILTLIAGLAAATDRIGVNAIFGGFLAGLTLPRRTPLLGEVARRISVANRSLLVPVFFASVGLKTDVALAVGHWQVLASGALLLLVAVAGKLGTAVPIGRAAGLPGRSALGLGVLLNARGITEIVVLSAGLAAGIIDRAAFTVLVLMALVTTIMVAPALRLLSRPGRRAAQAAQAAPDLPPWQIIPEQMSVSSRSR